MNVTTRAYDNLRSCANTTEATLTPANVAARGIRRAFSLPFEGDARGCEAVPLIVSGLTFPDGRKHDVVYSATMTNQVWAHDADTSQLLWEVTLANSVAGSRAIDGWLVNDHWGILSTPVIDVAAGLLYCVTWGSTDAEPGDAVFRMHAVDFLTGQDRHPPVSLEGASYTAAGVTSTFVSVTRKQRASLLITDVAGVKTIFIGAGSLLEDRATNQGWVIAVDVASWAVSAAWTSTVTGSGGGIWMAGAGLAADASGAIYLVTGNGDFDGVTNFGESIVKLDYSLGHLTPVDWFSPWLDTTRNGSAKVGMGTPAEAEEAEPTNIRKLSRAAAKAAKMGGAMDMGAWGDMDLGSGGVVLIPDLGLACFAGKDGILYAVRLSNMGRTKAADLAPAVISINYAKLAFPPIWLTYWQPGNPAPDDCSALNVLYGGVTHHQHGELVHWKSAVHGDMLFNWGENGTLKAWAVTATGITYLACSAEVSSPDCPPPGGMPGGMISLSANGQNDGILWASVPYLDANQVVSPGRLLAYDAQSFDAFPDGSARLRVLWDSAVWGDGCAYNHNKFGRITVANGSVYVPTYDGRTDVYTLA